jgi:hypothetical protein
MKTIADLKGQDVHWVQPNLLRQHYELRTREGEVVATLVRSGMINEVDQVEAAGGHWRIAHKGLLTRRFEIRTANGEDTAPTYIFQHTDGKLTLPNGEAVSWKKAGEPKETRWSWLSASGKRLLTLTSGEGKVINNHIRLDVGAASEGTRLLLVLLGCYLLLLYSDEVA